MSKKRCKIFLFSGTPLTRFITCIIRCVGESSQCKLVWWWCLSVKALLLLSHPPAFSLRNTLPSANQPEVFIHTVPNLRASTGACQYQGEAWTCFCTMSLKFYLSINKLVQHSIHSFICWMYLNVFPDHCGSHIPPSLWLVTGPIDFKESSS